MGEPLLVVDDLSVDFPTRARMVRAVRGVSFALGREKLAIVGESGSGKSVTGRAILGLVPKPGQVRARTLAFDGVDLLRATARERRRLRGRRMALVLQDPKFSLNPVMTVGRPRPARAPRPGRRAAGGRADPRPGPRGALLPP